MKPILPMIFVIEGTPAEAYFRDASRRNCLKPGEINFVTAEEMKSLKKDVEYIYPKRMEE